MLIVFCGIVTERVQIRRERTTTLGNYITKKMCADLTFVHVPCIVYSQNTQRVLLII